MGADVDELGPLKASLYAVVDLGRALAQVGPFFGVVEEAVLVGLLRCPDDTSGCARGVKAGVGPKSTMSVYVSQVVRKDVTHL